MIKTIKKFFAFCQKENRKKFTNSIILTVFQVFFEALKILAIYYLLLNAVKQVDTGETYVTATTSWICLGIMLVSVIGQGLVKNKATMLQTEGGYGTCANKRIEIAEHLRYVPMGYFNQNSIGQILSVTTNTMENLENLATRVIMMVSTAILSTLMITIMITIFDYRIGLILIVGLILFVLANSSMIKKSEKLAPIKYECDEELVSNVLEYIEGINEVKSYKLVGEKSQSLNQAIDKNADINYRLEKAYTPLIGLQAFIIKLMGVGMIFASIAFYLNGSMELANCLIMIIASFILYATLESASAYSALIRSIDICVDKGNEILNTQQMNLDGDQNDPTNLDIEIKNISFSYDKKKIIDNISLKIPSKSTTAIVGPSGGGKTTLTKLISRFFDVDSGSITLGGKDIRDYNYDTLMKNFSFVFQNVYLFKDTIANNIRFGMPEASMDEVIEASKKARCHEFIMNLPNGYDTVIGENGVNLSGGECQRLSIARAMMKDSHIIILDEATANIDPENEKELLEAIDELTKDKTIIMIAHRLKTVRNAQQIVVIENGKITEIGTHDELIKNNGLYNRFIKEREKAVSWKIE